MPEYMTWTYWTAGGVGGLHFGAALFCLILGPYILMRRKGDKKHRVLGTLWALVMLSVNVSALTLYDINGRPTLFHFFALMSLAALIPGYVMIWRYKSTRNRAHLMAHKIYMVWAYFGLASAGLWQVGLRIFISMTGPQAYGIGIMVFGFITFVMAMMLNAYLKKKPGMRPEREI